MANENDPNTFVPIPPQVAAKFPELAETAPTQPGAFPGGPAPGLYVGLNTPPTADGAPLDPGGYGVALPEEVFSAPPRNDTIVGAGAISEDLFGQPSDAALQRLDNFSEALDWLKRGNRIARADWNGQYLEIEHGRVFYHDGGARGHYAMLSDDLLATDWRIVS